MAANVCMVLKTSASTESNRQGTNILVVKGTAHTEMKDTRTKAMVITLASFGIGQLKKLLGRIKRIRRKMNSSTVLPFSGSKSRDVF